jgi:integrase
MAQTNYYEDKIATGFDRNVDFNDMKANLIQDFVLTDEKIDQLNDDNESTKRKLMNRLIYCIIAMIQLRNGSRIVEACEAFFKFLQPDSDLQTKVIVKIAKSKSIKYKKETNEKYETKTRYRKMIFPTKWITDMSKEDDIRIYFEDICNKRITKRVLDYLLNNFNCNTHSLRYAFINYMLYEKKKEMTIVAKFIGHSNVMQLVRYSQNKQADKLFDEDI